MKRNFNIGKHVVRVVTTHKDYGSGCYRPGIRLFLQGPNGSPAGVGPKAWPLHMKIRHLRNRYPFLRTGWHKRNHGYYGWTNAIYIPVPHMKWATAYKLRRVGGYKLYNFIYRATARVL